MLPAAAAVVPVIAPKAVEVSTQVTKKQVNWWKFIIAFGVFVAVGGILLIILRKVSGVTSPLTNAISSITSIPATITNTVHDATTAVANTVQHTGEGMYNTAVQAGETVYNAGTSVATSASEAVRKEPLVLLGPVGLIASFVIKKVGG